MEFEKREEVWRSFLKTWPESRVLKMTLEEYVSTGDKETFTYWLETKTRCLGSIKGGSSEKFGIYKRADGNSLNNRAGFYNDPIYTWNLKYGPDSKSAFKSVKNNIISVIDAIKKGDLSSIEEIDLAPTLKWKIAFIYQDRNYPKILNIYKDTVLRRSVRDNSASFSKIYTELLRRKPADVSILRYGFDVWDGNKDASAEDILEFIRKMDIRELEDFSPARKQDLFYLTKWAFDNKLDIFSSSVEDEFKIGRWSSSNNEPQFLFKRVSYKKKSIKVDGEKFSLSLLNNFEHELQGFLERHSVSRAGYWPVDYIEEDSFNSEVEIVSDNELKGVDTLNSIFYGPPGTGKTFHTIEAAVKAAEPTFKWERRAELKQEFDRLVNERRIRFVTFHQSYGYEEFVEGLKAKTEDGTITYSVEPGVFRQMCSDAEQYQAESPAGQTYNFETCWQAFVEHLANEDFIEIPMAKTSFRVVDFNENRIFFEKSNGKTDHTLSINTLRAIFNGSRTYTTGLGVYYRPLVSFLRELGGTDEAPATKRKNFVLVIDEINRGNISKIFGELITLIELSKRKGQLEALELTLPYSGDCFSVPDNLYIIGTMNTADRSLTMIDTALRRRFEFIEMMPKPELLDSVVVKGVNLSKLLGTLNQRIEVLYDREHTLGHAFFMNVKKCLDESDYDAAFEELVHAFQNKIIPLLQEYFFDDWNKIRLVLGDNQKNESFQLILEKPVSNLSLLFGQDHNIDPYDEGVIQYHLRGGKEAVWREPMTYICMYSSTIPEQSHSESDNKLEE
ncbi:McrB family protein [Marinomonas algicola]|uniref:McrB family protein n=1 Tax=Marinomonas algicola TaxID=2773454 RepID=UPI001EFF036D|nr:AAA family ATPase [Marinomonas algicola]